MKRLHNRIIYAVVFALLLTLTACGGNDPTTAPTAPPTAAPTVPPTAAPTEPPTEPPMTAEQVFAATAAAMKDANATRLRLEMAFDMTATEGEGDTAVVHEASMHLLMDTMAYEDPFGCYVLIDISMEADSESTDTVIEAYCIEEEASVVTYMKMMGMWVRSDSGLSVKKFLASEQMTEVNTDEIWNQDTVPANLTLDETTSTLNGAEVYVLRGNVPVTDWEELFANLGIADTSGYADLTIPVTYYIDAESFHVLRVEVQMSFMNDVLDEYLAQSLIDSNTEAATIEMRISDARYDLEYGIPPIPPVPQEAYDYLENHSGSIGYEEPEPTVYSGPLVLDCGTEKLLLTCPAGYEADYYDSSNIMLYTDGYTVCGDYFFWEDMIHDQEATRKEVLNLADINAGYLESVELLVSQGEGPEIEGYETWAVIGNGQSYYYAWREVGDGWLLIAVYDYSGIDNASVLLPQFVNYLSPYSE